MMKMQDLKKFQIPKQIQKHKYLQFMGYTFFFFKLESKLRIRPKKTKTNFDGDGLEETYQ